MKIKIAVDQSLGLRMMKNLEKHGYEIVCKADVAEADEVWMERAMKNGALFVVSPDLDIPTLIERKNLPMIWIDFLFAGDLIPGLALKEKAYKQKVWAQYAHDRIQAKLKFIESVFTKPEDKPVAIPEVGFFKRFLRRIAA